MSVGIDQLDARIIAVFTADPHIGVLGASRELGVARGTVQARLERLAERGVIRSFAPVIDPVALGYPTTAFCTLEIRQHGGGSQVIEHLQQIPEVLEVHSLTGSADLLIRVVARDNADLGRVIDRVLDHDRVLRANTSIALVSYLEHRTEPLVRAAARLSEDGDAAHPQ